MSGLLLRSVNQHIDLVLALARLLLQMARQFLFLRFGLIQVVISKLGKLLPELAFQLMPFTFELELVHDQVRKGLGSNAEHMERADRWHSKSIRLTHHCSSLSLWA